MRRTAGALVIAGLALLGCGDDGEGAAVTTTDAASAPVSDDGGDVASAECTDAAEDGAPDDAVGAFPDNPDVNWSVLDVRDGGLGLVLVELEPDSDEVGYPSFTFAYGCGTGVPERLATYALDGEDYVLLATTDAAVGIDFAPVLEE